MSKIFPVLESGDIRIVKFERKHLTQRYVSWLNDPEVVKFSEQRYYEHTLATCTSYFEAVEKTTDHFLAIEALTPNLGHIGNIGVAIDIHNRVADMSIIVGEKKAWGTGLATTAWSAVLRELLMNQGIRKVTAGTMAMNESMLRLMKRSGMKIEARRARHFIWEGKEVDLVQSAIFNNELMSISN
ncbi:putative N-acetyltransferase [Legionella lansingensis]|uniref:Putative N-acetyltransferase n=1 Tax=Legionella lansingensis TaxID=45067 RepID=A0A0W0VWD7_9GAMM|nr:GNAT family protein [Legionella lansingensis]KTD24318.1 putative N-acetyltransferase [Legionella lansingensis]SNV51811.1 putative N-acetyltransferase [Legionella lansingensis]